MSSAAWEEDSGSGSGGVGTSSDASWSTSRSTRSGSGRSCTRYRHGTPRCASRPATASLAAIIRCSIRRWDSVWARARTLGDVTALVEGELGLGGVEHQRAALLARALQRGGGLAGGGQRLAPGLRGGLAAGEDAIDTLVVQARVGADQRAVEGRANADRAAQLQLDGDRRAIDARAAASRRRWRARAAASARRRRARTRWWPACAPRDRWQTPRARARRRRRCAPTRARRPRRRRASRRRSRRRSRVR